MEGSCLSTSVCLLSPERYWPFELLRLGLDHQLSRVFAWPNEQGFRPWPRILISDLGLEPSRLWCMANSFNVMSVGIYDESCIIIRVITWPQSRAAIVLSPCLQGSTIKNPNL